MDNTMDDEHYFEFSEMEEETLRKWRRHQFELDKFDLSEECLACRLLKEYPERLDIHSFSILGDDGYNHACEVLRAVCRNAIEKEEGAA